jgi:ubiquinone/menaquinone biosynthesis C-methylase UbiE
MSDLSETGATRPADSNPWDRAASGWNAHTGAIRAWLRASTDLMLLSAEIGAGMRVLDVAAGAGDQTLDVAARVGTGGSVLATDLSEGSLGYARARAIDSGYTNIETLQCDGQDLPLADGSFDAVVCRLGLMLFPDPSRGLTEMHRVVRPGGKVSVLVFSTPENNPCLGIMASTAARHGKLTGMDPFKPGSLLSLGRAGELETMFEQAGFSATVSTTLSAPFMLTSARHYIDFVRQSGAPVIAMLAHLAAEEQQEAWREMEQRLTRFDTAGGWAGPNELLLVTGTR